MKQQIPSATVKVDVGINRPTATRKTIPMVVSIGLHLGTDTTITAEQYATFDAIKLMSEGGDVVLFVKSGGLVAFRDALDAAVRAVTDPQLTEAAIAAT